MIPKRLKQISKYTLVAAIGASIGASGWAYWNFDNKVGKNLGDIAPNFVLEDLSRNEVQLSDYRNKMPVVLKLWETWCGFCKSEMPSVQKFSKTYEGKVKLLALTTDKKGDTREFIAGKNRTKKPYTFTVLINKEKEVLRKFNDGGIPNTYIINQKGRIVYKHLGAADFMDSKGDIRKTIDKLLE